MKGLVHIYEAKESQRRGLVLQSAVQEMDFRWCILSF